MADKSEVSKSIIERLTEPVRSVEGDSIPDYAEKVDNPMLYMSKLNSCLIASKKEEITTPERHIPKGILDDFKLTEEEQNQVFDDIDSRREVFKAYLLKTVIPLYAGVKEGIGDVVEALNDLIDADSVEIEGTRAPGEASPLRSVMEMATSEHYERVLRNGIYASTINFVKDELELTEEQAEAMLVGKGARNEKVNDKKEEVQ